MAKNKRKRKRKKRAITFMLFFFYLLYIQLQLFHLKRLKYFISYKKINYLYFNIMINIFITLMDDILI